MSSGSKKIVVVGIVSNAIVTVLKFISALVATSASMMNEAIPVSYTHLTLPTKRIV